LKCRKIQVNKLLCYQDNLINAPQQVGVENKKAPEWGFNETGPKETSTFLGLTKISFYL